MKPATPINWGQARQNLLAFFGPDKLLPEVTVAEARDFERFLKTTARENRYGDSKKDEPLAVAQKHSLQVTDEHFAKAAQNPAQSAHATERMEPQAAMAAHEQTPVLPGLASGRDYLPLRLVGRAGLERSSSSRDSEQSAARVDTFADTPGSAVDEWLDGCPIELTRGQRAEICHVLAASLDSAVLQVQ